MDELRRLLGQLAGAGDPEALCAAVVAENELGSLLEDLDRDALRVRRAGARLAEPGVLAEALAARHAVALAWHLARLAVWCADEEQPRPLASLLRAARLLGCGPRALALRVLEALGRAQAEAGDGWFPAPFEAKALVFAEQCGEVYRMLGEAAVAETDPERRAFCAALVCPEFAVYMAEMGYTGLLDGALLRRLRRFGALLDDPTAAGPRLVEALEWLRHREGDYRSRFDQQYLADDYLFRLQQYDYIYMGDVNVEAVEGNENLWALAFEEDFKYTVFYQMSQFFLLHDRTAGTLCFEQGRGPTAGPADLIVMDYAVDFRPFNGLEIRQLVLGGREIRGFVPQYPEAMRKLSISGRLSLDLAPFAGLTALVLTRNVEFDPQRLAGLERLRHLVLDINGLDGGVLACLPPSLVTADLRTFGPGHVAAVGRIMPTLASLRLDAEASFGLTLDERLPALREFHAEQCDLRIAWPGHALDSVETRTVRPVPGVRLRAKCIRVPEQDLDIGAVDAGVAESIDARSVRGVGLLRCEVWVEKATPAAFMTRALSEGAFAHRLDRELRAAQCLAAACRLTYGLVLRPGAAARRSRALGLQLRRLRSGSD